MKITDLLTEDAIDLQVKAQSKSDLIHQMVNLMDQTGEITDRNHYETLVLEREKVGSTGVGEGIAIPHGQGKVVKKPTLVAAVIPDGVDYDALDEKPVYLAFLLAVPDKEDSTHLEILSRLSTLLMKKEFRERLRQAKTKKEFLHVIDEAENQMETSEKDNAHQTYDVVAITACITGIAHTYMAAESLETAGKEMGHLVKVETHGQSGVKNDLTEEEIAQAKAVIIASEIDIDLRRFQGKRVLIARVSDGIHKPKELIEEALYSPKVSVYHGHSKQEEEEETEKQEGVWGKLYRSLMNGITYMLPFVVGGGILIALAFLVDDKSIDPSNFGMNTPLAAFLKTAGGYAFDFMLCILAGYIAMGLADRPGLVVGFVGGAIAKTGTTFSSLADSSDPLVSSGFLGALLSGFLAGFFVLLLKRIFARLPQSIEGIKTILIYPVLGVLGISFLMIAINPFVGAINIALNNWLNSLQEANKILLGAILGGMMSVDLGGPVNKAAYTFGTGMIAEGHYDIMAAVMAGGMVPPLVIALLATFFPKRLPAKERSSALVNYVMGLSFISEGAIPFASADPIRVLVSCIIGSAITGALSMLWDCTLMAPHGGIFVIATVGHPLLYLAAIAIGSIVGMLILAAWKKNVGEKEETHAK